MIRTALTLARKGMAVFPCRPRDKRPATGHGLLDASTDPNTIRQWWQSEPKFNLAIATGAISKLFVLDVDNVDAEIELRRLESKHGALPASVEVITARGRHIYFRAPETPVKNSAGKIAPGIDIRGDGGYVLAPPSIHPTGRAYCWSIDSANAFAPAPDWLLAKISERTGGSVAVTTADWRKLFTGAVAEGARNCTLAKLCGHLLRRRVDPVVALQLLQGFNATRCAPPLPAAEVEAVVASICGKELQRRAVDRG